MCALKSQREGKAMRKRDGGRKRVEEIRTNRCRERERACVCEREERVRDKERLERIREREARA